MDTPDATRANAALWAHYLDQQWGRGLSPLGGVLASGLLGIGIANLYAAMWGDAIGRMFAMNAKPVTAFAQEAIVDALPPWTATPLPPAPHDALPPWLRISPEAQGVRRAREAELIGAGAR